MRSNPQQNWRRSLVLTAIALVAGISCLLGGLEASGVWQVALLIAGALAMFLFFAGIYVTLVGRYYYR